MIYVREWIPFKNLTEHEPRIVRSIREGRPVFAPLFVRKKKKKVREGARW